MTQQWSLPAYGALLLAAAGVVVVTALLVLVVVLDRRGRRAEERLAAAETDAAALREAVTAIERRLTAPATPDERSDYVITRLGDPAADSAERAGDPGGPGDPADPADARAVEPAAVVAGPLFADLVLRESVVQAASLAAGLRRAVTPETRHRIRFEMRREVKRARKQRRSDLRAARRAWEARERAAGEGSAA